MRIIAGELKGRTIEAGEGVRPTSDFVRQALFSILGGAPSGIFLDLHAGSGAVGIEALSRGAEVVLVEREPEALKTIRRNLDRLGVVSGITVIASDVLRFLKHPEQASPPIEPQPVDVVFSDPPYDYPLHEKLLRYLAASSLVGPQTIVIVERRRRARVAAPQGLELVRQTGHGETTLSFYRRIPGAAPT